MNPILPSVVIGEAIGSAGLGCVPEAGGGVLVALSPIVGAQAERIRLKSRKWEAINLVIIMGWTMTVLIFFRMAY